MNCCPVGNTQKRFMPEASFAFGGIVILGISTVELSEKLKISRGLPQILFQL